MHQQGQADLDINVRRNESHFRTKGSHIGWTALKFEYFKERFLGYGTRLRPKNSSVGVIFDV